MVLVGTLLAGVLAASFGVGYSATTPELDNATNHVPHGDGIAQVNAETQRVENEARALAPGKQELEVVQLQDGRTAAVNNMTGAVRVFAPGLGTDDTVTSPQANPVPPGEQPAVVAGKDSGYVIEPQGNIVRSIGGEGPAPASVPIPGGASRTAVPDGAGGIWVLTDDEKAVYVVRDRVVRTVFTPTPIRHISIADDRPVAITESGDTYDIAAQPLRSITNRPVPSGPNVVVGSPRGPGRYLLVLDRKEGRLFVVDPRTRDVHEIPGLPTGQDHNLGAPVILDDLGYIPDYGKHRLYVRELPTGAPRDDVEVPGRHHTFSLEVRDHRVWASDQFDQEIVVVGRDGRPTTINAGPAPGVETGPNPPDRKPPTEDPPASTVPPPPTSAPPPPANPVPPTSTTQKTQPPLVTVPTIPPGTQQGAACDRIRAVGLRCDIDEIGPGGPTGTVRETTPAGGKRVPEGSVVRVSVYGPVSVPDVVGQLSDAACTKIQSGAREPGAGGQLKCAKQPMPGTAPTWADLDVVAEQNPTAGQRVDLNTTVTVRFWNAVLMEDLAGRNGANECNRITTSSRNKVTCTVQSAGEAPTPDQTGLVASQSPQAGSPVSIGGAPIVLNIYGPQVPKVPGPLVGMDIFAACKTVQDSGYTCVPVADGNNPNPVVTGQDPPAGTPQNGGNVIVHYEPYTPAPLWLLQHNSLPVYIVRFEEIPSGYHRVKQLGRAYKPDQPHAGTGAVNGFFCTTNTRDCWGYNPNHYQTRDTKKPDTWPADWPDWNGPNQLANFFNLANGACPFPGQVKIQRFMVRAGAEHRYSTGYESDKPPLANFVEDLGCIWSP